MVLSRLWQALRRRAVAYYLVHMAYRYTPELQFPMKDYAVNADPFGKRCTIDGVDWGIHLGEDCNQPAGMPVRAIGRGRVVYAASHPGSKEKRNWGGVVIIAHKHPGTRQVFFSLYGHLTHLLVAKGDAVEMGQAVGEIAPALTGENGWWEDAHLHLAIYTGPWKGTVLPGYYREDQELTRLDWWRNPSEFIASYS